MSDRFLMIRNGKVVNVTIGSVEIEGVEFVSAVGDLANVAIGASRNDDGTFTHSDGFPEAADFLVQMPASVDLEM